MDDETLKRAIAEVKAAADGIRQFSERLAEIRRRAAAVNELAVGLQRHPPTTLGAFVPQLLTVRVRPRVYVCMPWCRTVDATTAVPCARVVPGRVVCDWWETARASAV